MAQALVGVIMGSQSDWETMRHAAQTLATLEIPHEKFIMSAHRTPERVAEYARGARDNGLKAIIAGAGAAAHLAGVVAAHTPLPVLGVPMDGSALKGMDSLLSTVQMPAGIPVATFAIGRSGAINAALYAAAMLALSDAKIAAALDAWRERQTKAAPLHPEDPAKA
jgi:5-(carboxyamino)imidazole ribonucleotide mutase